MLSTQCWALPYEYTAISYSTICTFKYDNKLQRFDIYKRYNEYISYLGKTAILSCCLASSHLLLLVSAVGIFLSENTFLGIFESIHFFASAVWFLRLYQLSDVSMTVYNNIMVHNNVLIMYFSRANSITSENHSSRRRVIEQRRCQHFEKISIGQLGAEVRKLKWTLLLFNECVGHLCSSKSQSLGRLFVYVNAIHSPMAIAIHAARVYLRGTWPTKSWANY